MQIPKYEQIAEALGREIREGVHPEGGLLPTEAQLSARFHVSRHTIRHGLRSLRERGLVRSRQGRGTEVVRACERSMRTGYHLLDGFASAPFDWTFRLEGVATVTDVDKTDIGLSAFKPMLRLSGVFRDAASGMEAPACIYLDETCGDVVPRLGGERLPDLLAAMHGLHPAEIVQEIRCDAPQDGEYDLCRLVMIRRYLDDAKEPYLVLRAVCPPKAFALHSILSAAD
ncbi:DNA-binding GntR family transcriptional regulator [Breoghania corrubedonensis]|uniref:DNA-binding GntR family transcriptional regulator n=1 Tax=Breoghania corrubedonensis TaxID=665038 RepID=A0A2T5VFD8_9HYPH|nr:GntR family transcriptional regulator [Breoghania corrubedonensis]PTW62436.1 DNA-binding GntR family transcriptional regulator [Breoghania corrubedonensis]